MKNRKNHSMKRRLPAVLLAFSLLLNMPGTVAAEETPEEIITETSEHTTEMTEDPIPDPASRETEEIPSEEPEETPEPIPSEVPEEPEDVNEPSGNEGEVPEEPPVSEETAEPKTSAFSDSVTVSGVTISVKADETVFPEGAALQVSESDKTQSSALSLSEEESSDDEQEEEEAEVIIASSYRFDVRILDEAGNPVQPKEGTSATLSFSMEEAENPNLTARVFREKDDGREELESRTEEGSVVLAAPVLSNYTIEFVYQRKTFPGTPGSVYKIKSILEYAGIVLKEDEKIEEVSLDSQGKQFAVLSTVDDEQYIELESISASDIGHRGVLSVRIGKITYEIKLICSDQLWYIYRDEKNTVGEGRSLTNYTLVSDTTRLSFTNGWYVFKGDLKFTKDRVTIQGDQVNFVLCDGATVKFDYGLRISGNAHLNIYGQANNSGMLSAESATSFLGISTSSRAAIGGNKNDTGGSITINGGIVEATGSDGGAGIGAAKNGTFGNIIINGGEVKAQGGGDAAGIGGGEYGGPISKIEINGGSVSATGGKKSGAGIGGGDESKDGGQIIINGGYVKAIGSGGNSKKGPIFWSYAAGIGGGKNRSGPDQIIIRGGKVEAYGGDYGAGIGGGDHASSGTILIYGGDIKAAGGTEGAAIGGGYYGGIGKNARVEIFGGSVSTSYFESSSSGAGIGGGNGFDYYNSNDQGGDVIIHDGFISIYANNGAGIGGGGNSGSGGNVTINGGQVMISSNSGAAIGGGGTKDVHGTDPKQGGGGKVTINGVEVCAISAKGGAAIGGGAGKDGGTLIINDGFVVAVTSPVTFDLINNIKYAKGTNANASFAISLARFVGKVAFANPQAKSPAAVGGGYFAGNADRGGDGGTLVMNGGTLIAKSGYKEVAAIGPGSGGKKNDAYTIPKNMKVLAGDDVTAADETLKPVLGTQRIEALKNKPVVVVMECFHEDAVYYSNEQGHIPQCRYCEEAQIMYPHDWDESGLVCKTCGYKRTGEISAELADPKAEYVFTGEEIKPAVTVSCFGRLLTEGKDYDVVYEKNIDAGTAEITVSGIGGYTGTKTLNFVIQKAQLLDLMLQRTLYPYSFHSWTTYDPETDYVTAESIVQPKAYDYYIMGQDYVDAGTWNVTAYAKNASNYQGTAAATITITPYPLDDCIVLMPSGHYVYDGIEKKPVPDVQVMYDEEKVYLRPDRDYTLSYENNKNAGTAKVIIQGCGNFTGRKEVPFTIEKAPVTGLDIEDPVLSYTGREQTLKIRKVLADNGTIPMSACTITGNRGREAGDYTVTVTVQNANYTGSISAPWSILPADASKFTASLEEDSFIYSGTAFTPEVTVKDGDQVLVLDQDYTLAYRDNILPGNAAAVITGMGSYAGTVTLPFRIEKAKLIFAELENNQLEYNGNTQTVSAAVVRAENGQDIAEETASYTIAGASAREAGSYTAVISAAMDSPYQGSVEVPWTIESKAASKLTAELIESSFVYDGEEKMPGVRVKDGERELRMEEDFTVVYQNNTDAGEAKAKVLLRNGYEGVIELPFVIAKARIDTFELLTTELVYNGGTQTVLPARIKAGELDVPEDAYLLAGNTAVSAGEYQAEVTARETGNYTGSAVAGWKIIAKSVSQFDAELSNDTFVFDGSEKKPGVTVRDGSSVLTEGEDYTLSYQNNVTAGQAKVIITGTGSYQGTKEIPFTILKAEIDTVDLAEEALIYNGTEQRQKIAGVYADGLEVPEEAYEILGDTGTDAG
ncbi:MAG: hypothetical protein IKE16_07630, partial [Solobacterium sp.]|nr:hypothetical protein [Solobacterium sp.]